MKIPDAVIKIGNTKIGDEFPTYFIADVAANHDGDLERAKDLIYLAAEKGANAAKFQHFSAKTIVSDKGFKSLETGSSHQSKWKQSVFDVYDAASVDLGWTEVLKETCDKAGIAFFTSPYSEDLLNHIDPYVPAHKIGSGDITWHDHIMKMAKTKKPIVIATGASNLKEVEKIYKKVIKVNKKICLMQCNTNYTGSSSNFNHINLNVLNMYKKKFSSALIGLSDHTHGHETVLGAVTLGARMIEKHFTDNNNRNGPDHSFSMNPKTWKEMIERCRNLEMALGSLEKKVEKNEKTAVILQRRSIRVNKHLNKGEKLKEKYLNFLRPCPNDAMPCFEVNRILNKKLIKGIKKNEYLKKSHFFK